MALQAEPAGIQDRIGEPPIRMSRGEARFDRVSLHYGAWPQPLFKDS